MTRDLTVTLAILGVVGQVLLGVLAILGALRLVGIRRPLDWLRNSIFGYELWLIFLVALIATAGSVFFSEVAHYFPCKLCWIQRIFMYPLAISGFLAALFNDRRAARYLVPLPVLGLGVALYHVLVEEGVLHETSSCEISAPGGCATKWIDELGYITIPVLAATAFALLIVLFAFVLFSPDEDDEEAVEHEQESAEEVELVEDEEEAERGDRWSYPVAEALLVLLVIGFMAAAGVVGWVVGSGGDDTSTTPTVVHTHSGESQPVSGRDVFASTSCGSCHTLAAAGASGSVGPNLDESKLSVANIVVVLRQGSGSMPAFKGRLSEAEIRAVAEFVAKNGSG